MTRPYNFAAGPAMLPLPVLEQAQAELLDWQGTGVSVLEFAHRSPQFVELVTQTQQQIRDLLGVSDDYEILFLSSGARVQFSMIPLNILGDKTKADYFDTGFWSRLAMMEAERYCDVHCVAQGVEENGLYTIPSEDTWQFSDDAAYVHYTANETFAGVQFHQIPNVTNAPLVSDMTSCLMTEPLDVNRFGIIYAGCQKNLGIAGLALAIVRRDLIGHAHKHTPTSYDFKVQSEQQSLYNTPPTFAIYICHLLLNWMQEQGGLDDFAQINQRKAQKLYALLDGSDFYRNGVAPDSRSICNVCFTLKNKELEPVLIKEAAEHGFLSIRGHKKVGGLRVSLYNAVSEQAVDELITFMQDFERQHG